MKRKHYILLALALFIAMTTCFYCATFAEFSFSVKICFGFAAVILYVLINLIPYFKMRGKDSGLSLQSYLKAYINEMITNM